MTRAHRIATIATFELVTAVKRTGYLVATFGMPLFIAAYGALVAIPAYYASRADQEPAVYGVVDSGDLLALRSDVRVARGQLPDDVRRTFEAVGRGAALDQAMGGAAYVFRPYAAESAARADLVERKIKGYFVVPPDYIASGSIDVYSPDNASLSMSGSNSRNAFSNIVRERLLSGRLDTATSARVVSPLRETRRFSVTRTGNLTDGSRTASIVRLAVPIVFLVLFLMSVLMTSSYLMQGTATEKENKVVEVLLASANPEEILAGKLFGLGAAGLIQISVWLGMLLVTGLGALPLLLSYEIEMPWVSLALAVPLFIVAFLFFGSLMLGTGSLGANMRESQQLAMVWSLTAALPMIMLSVLIREPHGAVARVMTWLPFSSAPVVMLRASTDLASLAWWEVAGSFAVLILSTWFAIKLGARLFRLGLLSASRPKLREIIRQARLSA